MAYHRVTSSRAGSPPAHTENATLDREAATGDAPVRGRYGNCASARQSDEEKPNLGVAPPPRPHGVGIYMNRLHHGEGFVLRMCLTVRNLLRCCTRTPPRCPIGCRAPSRSHT